MMPHYAMGTYEFVPASPFTFFSLSAWPRICIGKNFELMKIKMLASALFSKFQITTERDLFEYEYHSTLTLGIE
uniref:Cytochrome P450 n=1 Tax=Globisporangium ultimum (strain ATCC 200006 / CBS 805.95 / DAOM BR144) TaxID=431595 RepID=K3WVS1_GLOUD